MDVEYKFDASHGMITVDKQPVVFHCNHYNRFLQYTIQNSVYVPCEDILIRSAALVALQTMKEHIKNNPSNSIGEQLDYATSVFKSGGYGLLDLTVAAQVPAGSPIEIVIPSSHYGNALCLNFEQPIVASEFFDLGYAIGCLSAIYGKAYTGELKEDAISLGGKTTTMRLWPDEEPYGSIFTESPTRPDTKTFPGAYTQAPAKTFAPHIDENAIITELGKAPLVGADDTGLIEAFGVELTRMYADYYNLTSFRFEKHLGERLEALPDLADMLKFSYPTLFYYQQYFNLEGMDLAKAMLIEAGHVCGFNTMGGIMTSDAWKQLVMPMLETRDDWIQGIISCINALGWGVWRIEELVPNEKLVLRSWQPYESMGYIRWFGEAPHGVDYCMSGVACSLMNLMYEGDVTSYPELTLDYYNEVNRSKHSFWVNQTQCVAQGDDFSEIVVTRQARH